MESIETTLSFLIEKAMCSLHSGYQKIRMLLKLWTHALGTLRLYLKTRKQWHT
jgi:hypothetical protein